MIQSFRDKVAEAIFAGGRPRGFPPDLFKVARRRLEALNAAVRLEDLRTPPGNRLEMLSGSRTDRHSIRINDQRRICFLWSEGGAEQVEIVDYH